MKKLKLEKFRIARLENTHNIVGGRDQDPTIEFTCNTIILGKDKLKCVETSQRFVAVL